MKIWKGGAAAILLAAATMSGGQAWGQTDAQIRQRLIRQSIAHYPRTCPCPYSVDRAGRLCGERSAYSRPGGYAPLCYPDDITPDMIRAARGR